MKLKNKRAMCLIVGFGGLFLMSITAMQSDSVNMQLSTIIRQELLGLTMCWGGFYKGGYLQ